MLSEAEVSFIAIFLEGFLFGKTPISVHLATKEVQFKLFPGLGLYSGIFAMYLQCPSNKSRTAIIVSYVVCLLYVLSTATLLIDILTLILEVSNNYIC
jgi:hypothetical protein